MSLYLRLLQLLLDIIYVSVHRLLFQAIQTFNASILEQNGRPGDDIS